MTSTIGTIAVAAIVLFSGTGLACAQVSDSSNGTGANAPGSGVWSSQHPESSASHPQGQGALHSGTPRTVATGPGLPGGGPIHSDNDLKQTLLAKGYADVHDIKHEGGHYTAEATQDSKPVKVQVDAGNGRVTKEGG